MNFFLNSVPILGQCLRDETRKAVQWEKKVG